MADGTQLVQLFQNLIGNAVKFRKPDQPCLVHVGAERREGEWVVFVRDNGIGIEPEQHDRMFVIFQRLHSREKYPGTRHRPGDLQADRRAPWRADLGRVAAGPGRDLLLHDSRRGPAAGTGEPGEKGGR